jgi:hypothetical protein
MGEKERGVLARAHKEARRHGNALVARAKTRWLIYNRKEGLWWSNKLGWVDRRSATAFTTEQRNGIRYIPGVGSTWVRR